MNRVTLLKLCIFLLLCTQRVYAQDASDLRQRYASLGNFRLENGQQILNCKIGYRTFGTLNAKQSNVVIYPTGWGGTTFMMESFFGVGKDVDTTKFYLILIDALGNGVSSSPSNSIGQPKTSFPQFTIRDMVNSQYTLLNEILNIHHIVAVVGGSMGGLQALQWAVSYPGFMDKVVAIDATPKLSTYDLLWMSTYIQAVESDTAYHEGNYSVNPVLPLAAHLVQLVVTTPADVISTVPVDSFSTWLASTEQDPFNTDCNNSLWQLKACKSHDISSIAKGSLEHTAKMIQAKILIVANTQDHLVNQTLAIQFAKMANAKLIVMNNELGHLIFNEKTPVEATRTFLSL